MIKYAKDIIVFLAGSDNFSIVSTADIRKSLYRENNQFSKTKILDIFLIIFYIQQQN